MLRIPVRSKTIHQKFRLKSTNSSDFIRSTFVEYFVGKHGHKYVKSSGVVPLCDSTVPFVNAGMNQFKGVFLGMVDAPCSRAVNSQKCIRVGGKHNDLEVVGTDGTHHTFFEMLGNWSFGDYYKKEACQMAWDLLLGPYRLNPENLVVTYFAGDVVLGLTEDRETRDIWRAIGVPQSRLKALDSKDNFWEMGATGPCGPCTEIHYVHPDGTLTEIWNLVFIQCNRQENGKVTGLRRQHVDTGMGLERMAALLQGVPSNYDTDLFRPIIRAIEQNSKGVSPYGGQYSDPQSSDGAYRRLADHARMVAVCLADGVFPAASLNLKQIMRKSFKISSDIFQNPLLLNILYQQVVETLGSTYPELVAKEKDAKLIIDHELQAYEKMRAGLTKKWKELVNNFPEVEEINDVELTGFPLGYKEFKETMTKLNTNIIPGELVFKLYDTHGFQEEIIERVARLNNLEIDKKGFWKLLAEHKSRHKTAFKEQASNRALLFDQAVQNIVDSGIKSTNDQHKYDYEPKGKEIQFKPLQTKLAAILNEECEWIDFLEPGENRSYYLVTEDTNFYCEEGGQIADTGTIRVNDNVTFAVDSVFKIRDFVFHKGCFKFVEKVENFYMNNHSEVTLEIDANRRIDIMRNHTAAHLLNAAIRKVLPNSVVCQTGSSVTNKGLSLNLSVYGEKLSQEVILNAQELIRESINCNVGVSTRLLDGLQASREPGVVTVPGEAYPETGLRLVSAPAPLVSKELCCGTHVPSTGLIEDFCITLVKGAGGNTPTLHALTGASAKQVRELFCRAQKFEQVIDLVEPERRKEEISNMKRELAALCGSSGAPRGEYGRCLGLLDNLGRRAAKKEEVALQDIAKAEISEAFSAAISEGRRFVVHFVRCSYLMQGGALATALGNTNATAPALLLGCAGGVIVAVCTVPRRTYFTIAKAEMSAEGRPFVVHFVRCSYLMQGGALATALGNTNATAPALLLGCAGGVIVAVCTVPRELITEHLTAERWLRCVAPVFNASVLPPPAGRDPQTYAQMTETKVSLINCEQLVQDAMRVAIKYAQAHAKELPSNGGAQNRQQN